MLQIFHQQLKDNGVVTFTVRVRPHASESRVTGFLDDGSVKIQLAAAAEGGKANREVTRFLAKEFDVPFGNIEMLSGKTNRVKVVRIRM
ncbi:hypothetical protein COU77_04095 [Candidatus Peregrinibacteria bacterium CG10_big_fil_rev_8_21_14_0_10_49_16]|nr:MAG: hypothetical protein COW95_04515 [Candidatus Peregrinibacteria bacterium CG22_combo_CG10-13_8_21_14_all_49_11]PIR51744.1 MAG: hypothetical protein COU77_04095 [Candidatus Peregrinibacteria bacterium CG10_big_fil_rev_8_21_14_0_10_49_16]